MTSSTNGHGTNGHGSNGHATDGANGNGAQYLPGALWEDGLVPEQTMPDQGLSAQKMTYGSSGIGVHDLVPKLGFREYWYPALQLKQLGKRSFRLFGRRKPVRANIMGEDIVFFEGKKGPRWQAQKSPLSGTDVPTAGPSLPPRAAASSTAPSAAPTTATLSTRMATALPPSPRDLNPAKWAR